MNFRNINDMRRDIEKYILPNLPRDITVVYGVPRSGVLPASIIATAIGADLGIAGSSPIVSGIRKQNFLRKIPGEKILIVDDSANTAGSLIRAKDLLQKPCLLCAVYPVPEIVSKLDFYCPPCPMPRIFEWNFSGHNLTNLSYWDMDGVICEDPTVYDDDGPGYGNDIANLKPLYVPQTKVRAICTNRIEKWRSVTESWLARYHVQYGKLIMQPFKTAAERRAKSNSGVYKGQHFLADPGARLFVESDLNQAKQIFQTSNKPCLSIETMKMFS